MIKKKFSKKAQGLSFNVIILAILALVVLVVLIAIFSKQTGKSVDTLESCKIRGGECRTAAEGCKINEFKLENTECSKAEPLCCVGVFKEND